MKITNEVLAIFQRTDLEFKGRLQKICELLAKYNQAYDWVGFYMVDQSKKTLSLEAYYGESTQHTEIPFGKGICGQVAESNQVFISPDVTLESNYLSCSPKVKSEIVYPILINGKNVGQIDIDSHQKNAFNSKDERLLKDVCGVVAKNFPANVND
ncbi:MAG: GAF domain-containing protein [Flavobacteriaceae bacterium]|nr:GAF domain-containing protein [Flavobacteriaceae bacterium]MCY4216103.1 GAF domain-containing protein [Flavobacteriaceae bacterium]MCY4253573.1 GAF domain-containing protein [Flavobacteriaceae bacterium]